MQDLRIGGGFQWNPSEDEAESDIEGGSSGAEPSKKSKKSKRKSKQAIEVDATNSLHTGVPESTVDYERLVLGSPNSSYMWMRYMSHLLQLSELDKAREVARRALQTIHFREEQEKYNIWVAMLNMENTYGSEATLTSTFHEAARANDSKTIHLQMASIHHQSGKLQVIVFHPPDGPDFLTSCRKQRLCIKPLSKNSPEAQKHGETLPNFFYQQEIRKRLELYYLEA
jgi:rRNA biogenesis protein RRP5